MAENWVLRMPWAEQRSAETEPLLTREWLVTNGLGGYASGTVGGPATRRYHGLLTAALGSPLGRRLALGQVTELIRLPDGRTVLLGGEERDENLTLHGIDNLSEFRLEAGLPVWRYTLPGFVLEKRLLLPHRQNTTFLNFRLVEGEGVLRLKLKPSVNFRGHGDPVSTPLCEPFTLSVTNECYELTCGDAGSDGDSKHALPPLRLYLHGHNRAFTSESKRSTNLLYRVEQSRGYESRGEVWSPGYFRADLSVGKDVTLVASTEPWEAVLALTPEQAFRFEQERRDRLIAIAPPTARKGPARQLVLAADQFIITPIGRAREAARAHALGDEVRSVIAGYHWFTDWGRDTMISLEGLTLSTGRQVEAAQILRTFAHALRRGLLPNLFPEGAEQGLYHTADATLWFFHAIDRYVEATQDWNLLQDLLPRLEEIIDYHMRGTDFGIGVDSDDGLLRQGKEGYQLTWMDAKVGDWVVTPRRGKAVEINALWYNALRLCEGWVKRFRNEADARGYGENAARVHESFNRRFWSDELGYLYDVIDGEVKLDDACRPNQVFAISLPHSVLDPKRWKAVLDVVERRLLTPVGLRSLAPGHPDYKDKYFGDLHARDAAYHQGTVWAWLIGPFVDAWLKVHPGNPARARKFLDGLISHLGEACLGSMSEVFDAETPFTARGCIAQAWSIAEVLRVWIKTEA